MKILIAEDDLTSRLLLQALIKKYGDVDVAVNGREAVEAFRIAQEAGDPYDLVCMDIMMPELDGQQALDQIRKMEEAQDITSFDGAKILMTTAQSDLKNVMKAFRNLCDGYLTKPVDAKTLYAELIKLGLAEA